MSVHRILVRTIRLPTGDEVDIKYWADGSRIYVAGFDRAGNMVTAATYSAESDIADDFYARLRDELIANLARLVESDLLANPDLHYRKTR